MPALRYCKNNKGSKAVVWNSRRRVLVTGANLCAFGYGGRYVYIFDIGRNNFMITGCRRTLIFSRIHYYFSMYKCVCVFFKKHLHAFLWRPWVFSRALGCRARGGPPAHDASLGRGRAPWRVLWAFKLPKSGKLSRGRLPRIYVEPSMTIENPHVSCFAPLL